MSDNPTEFVAKLEKIVLEPGDTLLIRFKEIVSMETVENIRGAFQSTFPEASILTIPPFVEVAILDGEMVKNLVIIGDSQKEEEPG